MLKTAIIFLLIQLTLGQDAAYTSLLISEPLTKSIKSKSIQKTTFSKKFYRLEYSLLNQKINFPIVDSISSLKSEFEKDYLFALYNKRKANYSESFDQLYAYLHTLPKHYQFYDELILTAKASGNIEKVENFILKAISEKDDLYNYLYAQFYYNLNKYSAAIQILNGKDDFNMLYLLSFAYRGLADYKKSFDVLEKCKLKIDENDFNMPKVLVAEGSLYLLSGDYASADAAYNKALKLSEKFGNQKEKAKILINLAILDDQFGKTKDARSKMQLALDISINIENQDIEATVLSELGVSYTYTNEIIDARNNYEKSFILNKLLNNKERLSNLSANIAAIYVQQSNYSLALKFYNDGLRYAGENSFSKILNLRGLGDVYANLSNYSKALNYYTQAKKLASLIKNISSEAEIDISIGTLYYNISRPQKALQMFLTAKDKIGDKADPYAAEDVNLKIGIAYAHVDSINKSNIYLNEALKIARSVGDIYYDILISTELTYNQIVGGEYKKSEDLLLLLISKSKQAGFFQLESAQYLHLGKINFDQNKISKSILIFEQARTLSAKVKDYNTLLTAEFLLGKCYESRGDIDKAELWYLTAIESIDKISKSMIENPEIQISHFAGMNEPFNALVELYLKQSKNEKALQIIEKSRSRNTYQNLSNLLIRTKINDEGILRKYYDLIWQINSRINSSDELKSIKSELKNISDKYFGSDKKDEYAFSINSTQKNLNDDENIITYYLGRDSIFAFVVSKNNFKVVKTKISRTQVKEMINRIAAPYSERSNENDIYFNQDLFSFNTEISNEFYDSILKVAVSLVPENEKIIFSLPSEISLIPMEFLVTEFKDGDSPFFYDDKKYLIEKYSISYTPSISIFMLQKQTGRSNNQQILLMGDPEISNIGFASSYRGGFLDDSSSMSRNIILFPLKYSRQEIEKISEVFLNKSLLLAKDATEKNFKENARQSKIIHLSTHSFLYKDQPLIIFSKSPDEEFEEDGYLEVGEIYQLELNSEMVVLSSCKSGIGYVDKAEGILGMQKSFFVAGAKSVVVSMWDVNDKYTSLFMQSFYKYVSEGYDKSEALRKAKIFFKNNYSANPYYWAAFVLSGDISPIEISKASPHSLTPIIIFFTILVLLLFIYKRKNGHR